MSETESATTVGDAVAGAAAALAAAGIDDPRRRARRLVAAALALAPAAIFARPERPVAAAERDRLAAMLVRLCAGEPLSRIVGHREFWGLDFVLSPATLDPRPDSETVVEAVLRRLPDRQAPHRLLDFGTGSGCLLLALLSELPAATGIGVDIAVAAAAAARTNAQRLGLDGRARFVVSDWAAALAGPFDVVVANPPYIATAALPALPRAVRAYDPRRALDGGGDGLVAYRAIAGELPRLLRPGGGVFAGEVGAGQAAAVAGLLRGAGLIVDSIDNDLAGIARCVVARRAPSGDNSTDNSTIEKTVGMRRGPV